MTDPEVDDEALAHIVEFYHKPELHKATDYEKVVANKTTTTINGETIYIFQPPMQKIYLNTDGCPITIDNQKADPENNKYYYRWNTDPNVEEDTAFEYVAPYQWWKTKQPWQDWDDPEEE